MATANEALLHAAIDHSIDLTRYSSGVVRRIIALLNRTDSDLHAALVSAIDRLPAGAFTVERLDALLTEVRKLNARAYQAVRDGLDTDLSALVEYEAGYQHQLFAATLPVQVSVASVTPEAVYSAAMARPFQGRLLKEWAAGIESDRMARIRDAIRIGYVEGEAIDQMVRRIRGTKALNYADGLLDTSRRNVEALVRTAVSHTANFTRGQFFDANSEIIKGLRWTATLDSRTSDSCRARDGKVFPLDSGPRPPGHWQCRSTMAPVLKSWRELGIDMDEMPPSTRASMNGQVPGDITYGDWLKKQPAGRQDEILGSSRGKLFREGMGVDRFVDRKGETLTLDQLRKRDAEVFQRAGL